MSDQERNAGQFLGTSAVGNVYVREPIPPTPEEIAEWRKKEEEQRKAYEEQQRKQARAELRDRFALAALTGFLAVDHCIASDVARWSYEYADAMLKARGDE